MNMKSAIPAALALALCGCSILSKQAAPALPAAQPVALGGLDAASARAAEERRLADAARGEAERRLQDRDSQVLASVGVARDANKDNPEGAPKVVVDGELGRAQAAMGGSAKPEDVAAAKARAAEAEALVQQGKAAEARANYAKSQDDAKQMAVELGKARQAVAAAEAKVTAADKAVDDAREAAKAEVERNRRANQATIDRLSKDNQDLRDGVARETQLWLTMGCYGIAVLCVLTAGILLYSALQAGGLGIAAGARRSGLPAFFAVIFFALGRFTSQAWFWWACGTALVVTVVALVAFFVYDANRTKKIAEAGTKAQRVGDDIITAVHDIRQAFQNPPAALIHAIRSASTDSEAISVAKEGAGQLVDDTLKQYVTEDDGTAAYVDQRRRALQLV